MGSRVANSKRSLVRTHILIQTFRTRILLHKCLSHYVFQQGDDTSSIGTKQTDATSTMSNMAGRTATWKGNMVSISDVSEKRIKPNPFLVREMNQVCIY